MKAGLQSGSKPVDGFETPPTIRRHPPDIFQSPTNSVSEISGIDLMYHSFRASGLGRRRKNILPVSEDEEGADNVFATPTAKAKPEYKTPWEAVYAFRQGRKLVKPTFQGRVYNFLERPKEWKSILYHSSIYASILGSLLLSVLSTVAENQAIYGEIVFIVEILLVAIFTGEYVARFWSAGCRSKYLGVWGRLRFATKPICIIGPFGDFAAVLLRLMFYALVLYTNIIWLTTDIIREIFEHLIIIISSFLVIIFGSDGHTFGLNAIRGVRFLQILRMLHVDREGGCWRLLGSVVMEHRQEMFTALYIGFLGLVFSSYFMFLVEKDVFIDNMPSTAFATYADALWWGVVTMMTIGYGDKVPLTWTGRLLACISALFTVSFFALPAGILGSGFALKVQQQQRQKHFSRQIPVAATLIQTLWRCYAADKSYTSVATWKIHMKTVPSSTTKYNKTIAALRKRKPKYKSESEKSDQNDNKSYGEIAVNLEAPRIGLHQSRSVPDMMISIHEDLMTKDASTQKLQNLMNGTEEFNNDGICDDSVFVNTGFTQLSEAHKNAIRAIRKIKYFVAKRKFQQARKPYDVGDVIEQYSQGQLSMNVRLKELHRRLDQVLGKSGTQLSCKNGKPITLGEKLHQMDQQIQSMDRKIDNISYAIHTIARELQKSTGIEVQSSGSS